jgi:HEAT repeat protein
MRDLTFEPAWPIFTGMLATKYGYFAAPELATCGTDGITLLLQAMQNPNPIVRINAASTFDSAGDWGFVYPALYSTQIHNAALGWITNREPAVRIAGLFLLQVWGRDRGEFSSALAALLNDPDPDVRASAIMDAFPNGPERTPDAVLTALLKSSDHFARELGLGILAQNADRQSAKLGKQSVELALPLLDDPNPFVQDMAERVLLSMTGQEFSDKQTNEWRLWWDQNQTNFVVHERPERIW